MSLTKKLQSVKDLSKEQIKLITRSMPRESDELNALMELSDETNDKVLTITRAHKRDQVQFDECLSHVKAFARGGLSGVERLNEVNEVIFKHFDMEKEKWEILTAAHVGMDFQSGRLYARDN